MYIFRKRKREKVTEVELATDLIIPRKIILIFSFKENIGVPMNKIIFFGEFSFQNEVIIGNEKCQKQGEFFIDQAE